MGFFTDTNIPIGYTIIHDKWHESSKQFYSQCNGDIYWSNFVQKEYNTKLKNITQCISLFLEKSNHLLKNNTRDFVNYKEFENFILKQTKNFELDNNKKIKILEAFWNKYNFSEGISTTVQMKFNDFIRDFEKIYFKRDVQLNNMMKLHDCNIDNYLKYYDYALKLYKNGIHSPDCKIIMDAHDCGLIHGNITFVSNDHKMIEIISKIDTSHLEIVEFKSYN